ncbi:MAG: hypothetical protein MUF72_16725 [Elainella sp. Prado103]|jgi:Na+/H+ antiporter NhaD/arsenite permease-like protein|nr:hypothetical protein [Elainella sp. Prado103]
MTVLHSIQGESAFLAAVALLITRRIKPQRVLQEVDWSLLVIFSAVLSNLLSSVPAVLLLQSFIAPDATQDWLLLAVGAT